MKTSFVLPLVLLGAASHGAIALAQSPGMFTATGNLTTPRGGHSATLLTTGKVLIAGGIATAGQYTATLATAELYDPSTGAFTATGNMTTPRIRHTATLLPDGRVLIAGGSRDVSNSGPTLILASAELYDPSTGVFTAIGDMIAPHDCHGATLLNNGKVLITGAYDSIKGGVANAELYDPATGRFSLTGKYSSPSDTNTCQAFVSALLQDGRVLIVWEGPALEAPAGSGTAAELYDPVSGTFTATGTSALLSYYGLPTATLLMNGKILVAGGATQPLFRTGAELYDSSTGTFTATGNMVTGHLGHTATLLPDGTVLLAGSSLFAGGPAIAETYAPAMGTFAATGTWSPVQRSGQTATLLKNGQVLVTGGSLADPYGAVTSDAQIYHPVVLVPAPQLLSLSGDGQGQGAILHAGTARVVTASDPGVPGEVLEIYGTGLNDASVIPPQVAIGGRLAEVLWFGNTPGYPGLNQINARVPAGIAPGPAVPVWLNYLSRPSSIVTIGVN